MSLFCLVPPFLLSANGHRRPHVCESLLVVRSSGRSIDGSVNTLSLSYCPVFARNFFFPSYLPTERCREILPVAEAPGPRVLSAEEQRRLAEQEENTLRELRLFLRDVTKRLATDKRFNIFSKPVDIEEV